MTKSENVIRTLKTYLYYKYTIIKLKTYYLYDLSSIFLKMRLYYYQHPSIFTRAASILNPNYCELRELCSFFVEYF